MFTTHRPSLTLQLHNFDLFRTCRTALLRGPSAIAELLVIDDVMFVELPRNRPKQNEKDAYSE